GSTTSRRQRPAKSSKASGMGGSRSWCMRFFVTNGLEGNQLMMITTTSKARQVSV
ncbi:hypothetical protein CSUI_006558, partial [Cystoisospora suis]